ncbi:unnamed protein product [Paramecium octaurelia]|uniref:Uncharacterized protein n=1 Tax=Paramecium octaurelia TaxID=43137 RepID=A0A8S1VLC0_PAROT|nr:unnamed protein product [Paramecium octaurelia]
MKARENYQQICLHLDLQPRPGILNIMNLINSFKKQHKMNYNLLISHMLSIVYSLPDQLEYSKFQNVLPLFWEEKFVLFKISNILKSGTFRDYNHYKQDPFVELREREQVECIEAQRMKEIKGEEGEIQQYRGGAPLTCLVKLLRR